MLNIRTGMMRRVLLLSLVTAASFGCGTISYKPGGTQSDQQIVRDRCHEAGRAESPDFERCMKEQGWIVKRLGEPAAPSGAKSSAPSKSASSGPESSRTAGNVAPSSAPGNAPSAGPPAAVNSWFKFGGTADEFQAARQRCTAKLGTDHRSEPPSDAVTGEMLDCLRAQGWRVLKSH